MILAALLPGDFSLSKFTALMGLDHPQKKAYNHDLTKKQSEILNETYHEHWGVGKPMVLDPFSGGGSIPFEALRLGCDIISSDYSPLACMIQKATIQYPARYSKKMWLDLDETLKYIIENTFLSLKDYYPQNNGKDVSTYFHAWVVQCPECGFRNPMVSQWWLAKRRKKRIYLDYQIHENQIKFSIKTEGKPPQGNISRGEAHCLKCKKNINKDYLIREILLKEDEMLLATATMGDNGKEYSLPTSADEKALEKARKIGKDFDDFIHIQDILPLDEIPEDMNGKNHTKPYLKYWHKLLNPRQKILYSTLIESIREYSDSRKEEKPYTEAIITYLAFMVGKHINRNCRSTRYNRKHERITGTVSSPGISLLWDHTEINPFVLSSGSLEVIKNEILKGLEYSENHILKSFKHSSPGDLKIKNQSILHSRFRSPLIVTHIPYHDDVQYAELSDFFYVFEKSALNHVMDLPSESPKTDDLSISGVRSPEYFKHLFQKSFLKLHSMLEDDGLMVIYFPHNSFESWDYLFKVLLDSNFYITAIWPFHTHKPLNPIGKDYASLESSLIVVARKMVGDSHREVLDLAKTFTGEVVINKEYNKIAGFITPMLEKRILEFWNSGFRGTDLTIAVMGCIISILTNSQDEINLWDGSSGFRNLEKRTPNERHPEEKNLEEKIPKIGTPENEDLEKEKNRAVDQKISLTGNELNFKDILILSQQQVIIWVLNRFVKGYEKLDGPTKFYLFSRLCGLDGMSMKTANLILEAMDLDLETIRSASFIKINKSGNKKGLKILKFHERLDINIQYQIDATHISLNLYEMVGIRKVQSFLDKNPDTNYVNIISALALLDFDDIEQQLAEGILKFREISKENIRDFVI